tara:strand:+ start:3656 stop:3946 length:291 start_codon:yes stop_codon:yes gene_type:complete
MRTREATAFTREYYEETITKFDKPRTVLKSRVVLKPKSQRGFGENKTYESQTPKGVHYKKKTEKVVAKAEALADFYATHEWQGMARGWVEISEEEE